MVGLNRRSISAESRLTAWFLFAVNGMLVTTKMMVEALAGFGDWMTILHLVPSTMFPRVLIAVIGNVGVIFMVRRSGTALATLIPAGEPVERSADSFRIVLIGAAAAAVLVLGSVVAGPVGWSRGVPLALGGGLAVAHGSRYDYHHYAVRLWSWDSLPEIFFLGVRIINLHVDL